MRNHTEFVKNCILIAAMPFFVINVSCDNSQDKKPKANSPPVITAVSIFCGSPYPQAEFGAVVQCQDPDHDPVTNHYQWLRNEEEIPGENAHTLRKGQLKKGDLIQVKVTPSDGKANGAPFLSPAVKILNSPPVIQEVRIEPRVAYVDDHLKAVVQCSDADGDSVHYTYQWEKNGIPIAGESRDTLQKGQFKKGDSIVVAVTPDDGQSQGFLKKSEINIISNCAPVIASSPSSRMEGNVYTYQVQAIDPDGDPILFKLKSGPKGMVINKETGFLRWEVQESEKGISVEIEASDGEGAKSIQKYTLTVARR